MGIPKLPNAWSSMGRVHMQRELYRGMDVGPLDKGIKCRNWFTGLFHKTVTVQIGAGIDAKKVKLDRKSCESYIARANGKNNLSKVEVIKNLKELAAMKGPKMKFD